MTLFIVVFFLCSVIRVEPKYIPNFYNLDHVFLP